MKELDLQDKYLIHFLCERPDGLRYKEAKAITGLIWNSPEGYSAKKNLENDKKIKETATT